MIKKSFLWMILAVFAVTLVAVPADAKFITVSGRAVTGYFQSDKGGALDTATFAVPDIKLVSTFDMPADIKGTFRLNLNNNAFGSIDYAYLDIPLGFMGLESVKSRIGQFKIPLGVETFIDNSVEQPLANNSAGLFGGNDRGIMFMGKADVSDYGLTYDIAVTEGTNLANAAGADRDSEKALTLRLGTKLTDAFSVWGSYYRSGDLGAGNASGSVGGISTMATDKNWERKTWLFHGEYKMESLLLKGYFGEFEDDSRAIAGSTFERKGKVWMGQAVYDITDKVYISGMYSKLDMKGDAVLAASGGIGAVSGTTGAWLVNELKRTEIGIGYRLGEWVTLKYAWMNNKRDYNSAQKAAGIVESTVDDDMQSAFVAVKF